MSRNGSSIAEAINAIKEEVSVEIADTPALRREAFQLRYQVYCVERGFEPGSNGIETDDLDHQAQHAVIRWRDSREVVGTVRLILPTTENSMSLPIHKLCEPDLLRHLPASTIGEGSRFAISKERRGLSAASCSVLRLALMQAAIWLSHEAGHTHMLAVMEPSLVRILRGSAFHFVPVGPLVQYHGVRQPVVADMVPTLARMYPAAQRATVSSVYLPHRESLAA